MANSRAGRAVKGRSETNEQPAADFQTVERVAYELFVQRGRVDGHDFKDWLKAEEIVRKRRAARK